MKEFTINPIGYIKTENGFKIELNREYIKALKGLNDFKYIKIICWFDKVANRENRNTLIKTNFHSKKANQKANAFGSFLCIIYLVF